MSEETGWERYLVFASLDPGPCVGQTYATPCERGRLLTLGASHKLRGPVEVVLSLWASGGGF